MARPQLRIYYGPHERQTMTTMEVSSGPSRVTVPLRDVFPVLADAIRNQRTWLRDFADDEISISTDLYEVILASQHYRRPSA
jgi:hypothetical protein